MSSKNIFLLVNTMSSQTCCKKADSGCCINVDVTPKNPDCKVQQCIVKCTVKCPPGTTECGGQKCCKTGTCEDATWTCCNCGKVCPDGAPAGTADTDKCTCKICCCCKCCN